MYLWSKDQIHYHHLKVNYLFTFKSLFEVFQSNTVITIIDFECFHNLYSNLFRVHEIGKLWTGLVLLHI